jgi:hypothetical protein
MYVGYYGGHQMYFTDQCYRVLNSMRLQWCIEILSWVVPTISHEWKNVAGTIKQICIWETLYFVIDFWLTHFQIVWPNIPYTSQWSSVPSSSPLSFPVSHGDKICIDIIQPSLTHSLFPFTQTFPLIKSLHIQYHFGIYNFEDLD